MASAQRPPLLGHRDSSAASASTNGMSPAITPEPESPSSTSGNSSGGEMDEFEEIEDTMDVLEIVPALASPTTLQPTSPWPFGSVQNRGRSNSVITAAIDLSASQPSPSALPHEILLAIFKMVGSQTDLRSCIRVCKSWCQCGVELLWHKPNFIHRAALDHHLKVILNSELTTFPYALFIKRINFSMLSNYVDDSQIILLAGCARMERLTMTGCEKVTDFGMQHLFSGCHQLLALDLSDCTKITDLTCEAIAANLRRLQGLNLSGCQLVGDQGIIAISRGCSSLRRMKLRNVERITDLSMINLAYHCHILLEVDLSFCPNITDAGLWAIWRNLSHLRELFLNGANLTDRGFPQLDGPADSRKALVYGQGIQEAVVMGFNGRSIVLGEKQKAMQSQAIVSAILENHPIPNGLDSNLSRVANKHFQNIRALDLTAQSHLTDAAVESIITFMPKIRNLVLAKCHSLTDDSVFSICRLGKALHYLHLGHCIGITDRAVARLARTCTRMRYIDLACCQHLTDASVFELANLTRLKRIGLVRVTNLTDEAIFSLVERKSLERLHLSYCENISVQAIHFLLQALTNLTHLSLTGVPSFRRTDLQAYCRPPPKEFNVHQQQAFCVYSGRGVSDLRRYLNNMRGSANAAGHDQRGLPQRRQAGANGLVANPRNIAVVRPRRTQRLPRLPTTNTPVDPTNNHANPPPPVFFPQYQTQRPNDGHGHGGTSRNAGSAPPNLGTFSIPALPPTTQRTPTQDMQRLPLQLGSLGFDDRFATPSPRARNRDVSMEPEDAMSEDGSGDSDSEAQQRRQRGRRRV